MRLGESRGLGPVAPAERGDDRGVALLGHPPPLRHERVEAVRDEAERRPQHEQELRRVRQPVDRLVEPPVGDRVGLGVAGGQRGCALPGELPEALDEALVGGLAGAPRELAREDAVDPVDVADVVAARRRDRERATGRELDEALRRQRQQRLAYGHRAHAERPRELVLGRPPPGRQLAHQDHVAQPLRDRGPERLPLERAAGSAPPQPTAAPSAISRSTEKTS